MSHEVKKDKPAELEAAVSQVFDSLNGNFNIPSNLDVVELQKAQQEGALPQFGERGVIAGGVAEIYANGYGVHSVGFNQLGREFVEEKLRERGLDPGASRMLAAHKSLAA